MFFCADDFSQPGKLVNALSETSYHFFSRYWTLGIALRYILEALRKQPNSNMYLFGVASLERFKTKYGVALLHSQNSNMFLLCYSLCGKYFLGCPFIYMWPSFFLFWFVLFVKNTLTCTFGYHHVCPSVFLMITQSQHSAETLVPAKDQLCLSEPLMLYIFFL